MGALQVYFPGQFQPATSAMLDREHVGWPKDYAGRWLPSLPPDGPYGLPWWRGHRRDVQCAVSAMALWLERPRLLFRDRLAVQHGIGLFALYLCQVRSLLVMLIPALFASMWSQLSKLRFGRVIAIVAPLLVTAVVAFGFAVAVGGDSDDQQTIYVDRGRSRDGLFLESGLLPGDDVQGLASPVSARSRSRTLGYDVSYFGDPYNPGARRYGPRFNGRLG